MAMHDVMLGNVGSARRDLRREEMAEFGHELGWLRDPSLIPEDATRFFGDAPEVKDNPYFHLAAWMVTEFTEWSSRVHGKLSYGPVFEKRDLENPDRVRVRDAIREEAKSSYAPGTFSVAETVGVVPLVAHREGVDREHWGEIADRSKAFGELFSRDGTQVSAIVREYLSLGKTPLVFDPSKFKLDEETGITTVTPIEEIVPTAKAKVDAKAKDVGHSGVCVALQAVPKNLGKCSMFGLTWDAYSAAAQKLIYPSVDPAVDQILPQAQPDDNLEANLEMLVNEAVLAEMRVRGLAP